MHENSQACDFCGRPAMTRFKTRDQHWCCSMNIAQCPAIRQRNSEKAKARPKRNHTEATKEKIRLGNIGKTVSEETKNKLRGRPFSEEHRTNLSISCKGRIPWNKSKTGVYSDETRRHISAALIGNVPWNKGLPRTEEVKSKISIARLGKPLSEEHKQAIGNAHRGQKRNIETRQKISASMMGEKHPQWKGGISTEPYCSEWKKDLKEMVKERDGFHCMNCGTDKGRICVHHINYKKKDCSSNNLITLCNSCNSKANTNRDSWKDHFTQIMIA